DRHPAVRAARRGPLRPPDEGGERRRAGGGRATLRGARARAPGAVAHVRGGVAARDAGGDRARGRYEIVPHASGLRRRKPLTLPFATSIAAVSRRRPRGGGVSRRSIDRTE